MGNTITRLKHHRSRHIHHDVAIPVTLPTPPPNHIDDASHTRPARAYAEVETSPPRKPSLDPVPEAIIAATESGMVSENLLCSSLPSPVLRQQPRSQSEPDATSSVVRRAKYGYFPAAPGSVGSTTSSEGHVQPRHESEPAAEGMSKRESVGSSRRVRWKGMNV